MLWENYTMDYIKNIIPHNKDVCFESIGRSLNSIYVPYYSDKKVWTIIRDELPEKVFNLVRPLKENVIGHKIVNDFIMNFYPNERVIKYNFIKKYLGIKDEVTFFEMNVNKSRVDLGRVNGKSLAYEIKTELDTVYRLEKQINDYMKVFEYVNIITHKTHTKKIIDLVPQICGIIEYRFNEGNCSFRTLRKAKKNNEIEAKVQIDNLSSEDLRRLLVSSGYKNPPNTREERENLIYTHFKEKEINELFKIAIKNRFGRKWQFLCDNIGKILPIDIQSFFHDAPINPDVIYYKSSSIV